MLVILQHPLVSPFIFIIVLLQCINLEKKVFTFNYLGTDGFLPEDFLAETQGQDCRHTYYHQCQVAVLPLSALAPQNNTKVQTDVKFTSSSES